MRRGRPQTEKEKYDKPVNTYVTGSAHDRFVVAAKARGQGKAAMARALIHQFLDGDDLPTRRPRRVQAEAVRELNSIGVNLNQTTRALNAAVAKGEPVSVASIAVVEDTIRAIQAAIAKL